MFVLVLVLVLVVNDALSGVPPGSPTAHSDTVDGEKRVSFGVSPVGQMCEAAERTLIDEEDEEEAFAETQAVPMNTNCDENSEDEDDLEPTQAYEA